MSNTAENNKRIAKNTLLLYVRMFFIMSITLFTSRVVLSTLGVSDFGIYNVVGGVVAMMGILNSAMSVSTQRYLTFDLGRGDKKRLKQVFSLCLLIFILLSLLVLLIAETVGLWFLNNKMTIPEDRLIAANWVYQFSVLSCIASLILTPYNATIIAHEKMNIYAYIGILEAILKLAIVYLLLVIPTDRLSTYGFLVLFSQTIITSIYVIYCKKHFRESKFQYYWDSKLFMELISYSGWNLFGALASLVKGQGLNILLNIFFTPAVNAARGISYQINTAITQFFTNFYTAIRPQITKYYAQNNLNEMINLIFKSSKLSFFLILIISLPIVIETPYIIQLWLGQLPDYVIPFTRIIIAISAIDSMATPLMTAAHATGKIKLYQGIVGTATILNIPISYIFLKIGYSPLIVFYISLIISTICLFLRVWIVQRLMTFPSKKYIIEVFGICLVTLLVAFIPPFVCYNAFEEGVMRFLLTCTICLISSSFAIYFIGLTITEKKFVIEIIKKKILKR